MAKNELDGLAEELKDVQATELQFTLGVTLGNEASWSGHDVAEMLRKVADYIDRGADMLYGLGRPIQDENGNTVGRWDVVYSK